MKVNLLLSALATFAAALPSGGKRENETYNPDTRDCNDCKDRYEHCVKLAGVSGLPWCENICRVRVKEGYGTVDNASREVCGTCNDGEYYPAGPLIIPPDEPSKRAIRDNNKVSTMIADAVTAGFVTREVGLAALNELL